MQLDSLRVLDLTRLLPGPYATQLLADAGAEILKIEDTGAGDYARALPPYTDAGTGAVFDAVNRGKKGIALDLKTDQGREVLFRLVEDADVLIESFRPGVVDRLGISYEAVTEHNEDIVYCSLSGYGQTGPLSDRVGHDLNYIGRAGLLDLTRADEDAKPQMPGYQIADLAGGLFAAFSILGGLLSREFGHGGEYVDVAMTDVVLSFSQVDFQAALREENPRPGETPLTGGHPWYDVYKTADERYVTFAGLEPKFFQAFCEAVDREDLVSEHGTTDEARIEALREELTAIFQSRTRDEWSAFLEGTEASVEPVLTLAEALGSEHVDAREMLWDDRRPRLGFPAMGSDPPTDSGRDVPAQGEHTAVILSDYGYDGAEIDRLAEEGVILRAD